MRRRRRTSTTNIVTLDFEKTDFVDKELIDKVSLWVLRIILKLGGHKEFIKKDKVFDNDILLAFLDGTHFSNLDDEEYKREDVIAFFNEKLKQLENKKEIKGNKTLDRNIAQISSLMNLKRYEEKILEFTTILRQYELLNIAANLLGLDLNTTQTKNALAIILDIKKEHINKAFSSNSKLTKSSLVTIDKSFPTQLERKLESISDSFLDNLLNLNEDITLMLRDSIKSCGKSLLKIKDYKHINMDLKILLPYLESSIVNKKSGVNILLYGLPGTGKTELAKVIAKKLKTKLFEVSYSDEYDEPIDGKKRLKAYKSAQALLSSKKALLMYDEAEDIFESSNDFFYNARQKDKAWINRVLETNTIPTIWITNNINSIDNAIVRRFDMSIEIPIPAKSKREEILKRYSNNLLDEKSIKVLSESENIAPSLISSTAKVIHCINAKNNTKSFTHLLNSTLKAQGYDEVKNDNSSNKSDDTYYNPNYVNTSINLDELTHGIKDNQSARICLYGIPGTGKSAFGKYLADFLDKPLLVKKGSDLISKWVGETEKNIANAFKQAKESNCVLIFDEVDSFLANRASAKQNWEITQVNEMLVQMENFDGIFIATTNLMNNLDKASLRRFDLKLELNSLNKEQSWNMFKDFSKQLNLSNEMKLYKTQVENIKNLTPGDFAAVIRQNKFRAIKSNDDFINRLIEEVDIKDLDPEIKMGFIK